MRRGYNKTPGAKASRKKFNDSEKGLASRQRSRKSVAGKLRKKKYAEKQKAYRKKWLKTPKGRALQKRRNKQRRSDDKHRFDDCLGSTLSRLLSGTTLSSKKSVRFTGFQNAEEFRAYIQTTWTDGMDWSNYGLGKGKWVVDHICPKILYDHRIAAEVFKCWNWRNLRACWWDKNLSKHAKWEVDLVRSVPTEYWPACKRVVENDRV